jgi:hypothetical protein
LKSENEELFIGISVSFIIASIISLIPVWQLIIIPGVIVGALNKTLKKASFTSGIGTLLAWSLYTISGLVIKNTYLIFDQFGALIIGSGYGWVFMLIILLMGLAFGIIGGALGYFIKTEYNHYKQSKKIEQ